MPGCFFENWHLNFKGRVKQKDKNMKKHINMLRPLLVAFMVCSLLACGGKKETDSAEAAEETNEEKFDEKDTEKDADFAVAAADGGMLEVQLGQLAVSKGTTDAVKKFGQSMVDDHSKANNELKALAAQKNITLPSSLSDEKQKKYNDLSEKTGAEFDKAYAKFMVEDHKEDIDAFKKEAENGKDADLKSWAAGKVPVLEHHLSMAEQTRDAVDK
jgi:putative membrane protein